MVGERPHSSSQDRYEEDSTREQQTQRSGRRDKVSGACLAFLMVYINNRFRGMVEKMMVRL
jgi:hypothetical protein